MSKTIQVPVVLGFGNTDPPIGYLVINEEMLPATPDFVFTLGYELKSLCSMYTIEKGPIEPYVTEYKLREAALLRDKDYFKYLQHIGYK